MSKAVPFELCGKQFSLAYTAKASRSIDERYGGIDKVGDALSEKQTGELMGEVMWLLSVLLRGGYDHEKAMASLYGEEFRGQEPPSAETLESLYVLSDMEGLEAQVFRAIGSGSKPDIQIKDNEKNAEATPEQ